MASFDITIPRHQQGPSYDYKFSMTVTYSLSNPVQLSNVSSYSLLSFINSFKNSLNFTNLKKLETGDGDGYFYSDFNVAIKACGKRYWMSSSLYQYGSSGLSQESLYGPYQWSGDNGSSNNWIDPMQLDAEDVNVISYLNNNKTLASVPVTIEFGYFNEYVDSSYRNHFDWVAVKTLTTTMNIPTAWVPSFNFAIFSNTNTVDGKYYKDYSGVSLQVSSISLPGGATKNASASTISFNGKSGSSDSILTVNPITSSGNLVATAIVRDSRGKSTTKNITIPVEEHGAPNISAFTVERCKDDGEVYTYGENVSVSYLVSCVEDLPNTTLGSAKLYSSENNVNWTLIDEVDLSSETESSFQGVFTNFSILKSYYFKMVVTDSYGFSSVQSSTIIGYTHSNPLIQSFSTERCNSDGTLNEDGTNVKIVALLSCVEDIPGTHLSTIEYYVREYGSSEWVSLDGSSYDISSEDKVDYTFSKVITNYTFDVLSQYEVLLIVTDSYDASSRRNNIVDKSYLTMDFKAGGKGIAFGKAAEKDGFECDMEVFLNKKIYSIAESYFQNIYANEFVSKRDNIDFTQNPSSTQYCRLLGFVDKNKVQCGYIEGTQEADGSICTKVIATNRPVGDSSNSNLKYNIFSVKIDRAGNCSYAISHPAGFRSTISAIGAQNANGYWGLTEPNGDNANWIRTTQNGIIPYQSGGHGGLGTSSWPFNNIYGKNIYKSGRTVMGYRNLYANDSNGLSAGVTLSETAANFVWIDIFTKTNDGAISSTRVHNPNGKNVFLLNGWANSSGLWFKGRIVTISGTSITTASGNLYSIAGIQSGKTLQFDGSKCEIGIIRVDGWS